MLSGKRPVQAAVSILHSLAYSFDLTSSSILLGFCVCSPLLPHSFVSLLPRKALQQNLLPVKSLMEVGSKKPQKRLNLKMLR